MYKRYDMCAQWKTGFLSEAENAMQLAESMCYLLNEHGKAEEMGLKGKEFVKGEFAIEGVVDELERVYKELC